jgi:hypothetical protein
MPKLIIPQKFEDLTPGQWFTTAKDPNTTYIKTEPYRVDNKTCNATNLLTNEPAFFFSGSDIRLTIAAQLPFGNQLC